MEQEATVGGSLFSLERISQCVAVLYLAMLAFPVTISGQLLLSDFLVPVMLCTLVLRRGFLEKIFRKYLALGVFLALSAASMSLHLKSGLVECYEWCVFAYMAVVFMFFSEVRFASRHWLAMGFVAIFACALCFVYEIASAYTAFPSFFSFFSDQMASTAMPFLSRRFAFTLDNPNIFAVFYAMAFAMASPHIERIDWAGHTLRKRIFVPLVLALLLLPLVSSASKHGLLAFGIMLAWMPKVFCIKAKAFSVFLLAGMVAVACMFEITVLFTTFPLACKPPFVNTLPGMYSLHQSTYARMLASKPWRLAIGTGATGAKELYPSYVKPDDVRATLEAFNAMPSYGNFIAFMDPHNEYLNLLALFGLPATLACLAFWIQRACRLNRTALFFGVAVLCCCLWDDLLSKRFIWVAAALVFQPDGDVSGNSGTQGAAMAVLGQK